MKDATVTPAAVVAPSEKTTWKANNDAPGPSQKGKFAEMLFSSLGTAQTLWKIYETSLPYAWGVISEKYWLCLSISWILDIVVCIVVGVIQALIVGGYASLPWDNPEESKTLFTYLIMVPFPLLWHICQYASFTIQTTGHTTVVGHLKALYIFGPTLLLGAGVSVATFSALHFSGSITEENRLFLTCLVSAAPILIALWIKSALKCDYLYKCFSDSAIIRQEGETVMRRRSSVLVSAKTEIDVHSSVSTKPELLTSAARNNGVLACEYRRRNVNQTFKEFKVPATCFVWTILFSSGLVLEILSIARRW